eukprot:11120530-Ditylum_brightwellii.AAC.1
MGAKWNKGLYLGPSREHFRCYNAYIPSTKGEWVAMTVDFHIAATKLPYLSLAKAATQTVQDLTAALQSQPINDPFKTIGDTQLAAIKDLAKKIGTVTAPNSPQQTPSIFLRVEKGKGNKEKQQNKNIQ